MPKAPYAQCNKCPLKDRALVKGKFRGEPKYILLGEAPGNREAQKGEPFIGDSGQLLSSSMQAVGLDPDAVFVTNTLLCHPPRNKYSEEAAECCRPRLEHELKKVRERFPVPIVALGIPAAEALVDNPSRNRWFFTEHGPVLPVYHPAYILRRSSFAPELLNGLDKLNRPVPTTLEPNTQHTILEHAVDVHKWVDAMIKRGGKIAWDLETSQISWMHDRILCLGASWDEGKAIIIPGEAMYSSPNIQEALHELFAADNLEFVAHNGKFDVVFMRHQLKIQEARCDFDSMLAHYVLDERTGGGEIHSLKTLVSLFFDIPDYEQELVQRYLKSRNDSYAKVPRPQLYKYCAIDCDYTLRLAKALEQKLHEDRLYEQPFQSPLMEAYESIIQMELLGVPIDLEALEELEETLVDRIADLYAKLKELAGHDFNPNSWIQKGKIIYDEMHCPVVTGRGIKARSTNKNARAKLKVMYDGTTRPGQFLRVLDKYARVEKLRSSYVSNIIPLIVNGRVHPYFKLHGTETGRLAASNPAIQTIPRPGEEFSAAIKKTFRAEPGWSILQDDYSQAEMRVAAALSGDEFLIQIFKDDRDLHSEVAVAMYGEDFTKEDRILTKMFNFSYLYGGNEHSFAQDAGLPLSVAQQYVQRYDATMPKLAEWKVRQFEVMREQGYIDTPFRRRRRFPLIIQQNFHEARKASVNMPTQSSASDLTLISSAQVYAWLLDNPQLQQYVRMIITVHDSIIFEVRTPLVKEVGYKVKEFMENVGRKVFPQVPWKVDVEAGPSWGELKPV